MRGFLFAIGAALTLSGCRYGIAARITTRHGEPQVEIKSIKSGGYDRSYALYVPPEIRKPVPLVIGLHGLGGNGKQMIVDDGWVTLGEREHCIVAGPSALPRAPEQAASFRANPNMWRTSGKAIGGIDDVQFIRDMIREIEKNENVDKKRIYVVGHSNGGGMTFRMATDDAAEIAAIGAAAPQELLGIAKPAHPMPTMIFMGTEDPLIPPAGGHSKLPGGRLYNMPPATEFLSRWAGLNGFPSSPQTAQDDKIALVNHYGGDMETWLVKGQGHGWPGKAYPLGALAMGPQLSTVDATAKMWEFLSRFRLP